MTTKVADSYMIYSKYYLSVLSILFSSYIILNYWYMKRQSCVVIAWLPSKDSGIDCIAEKAKNFQ